MLTLVINMIGAHSVIVENLAAHLLPDMHIREAHGLDEPLVAFFLAQNNIVFLHASFWIDFGMVGVTGEPFDRVVFIPSYYSFIQNDFNKKGLVFRPALMITYFVQPLGGVQPLLSAGNALGSAGVGRATSMPTRFKPRASS